MIQFCAVIDSQSHISFVDMTENTHLKFSSASINFQYLVCTLWFLRKLTTVKYLDKFFYDVLPAFHLSSLSMFKA